MTQRIVLLSPEVPQTRMAGPALRFWHMADTLAARHDVVLAVERATDLESDRFEIVPFTREGLAGLARRADVVIVQGYGLYYFPEVRPRDGALVVDLYDPFHIEAFETVVDEPLERRRALARSSVDVVRAQLEVGDFFLCASERQRVFWLGHLAALHRLTPDEHDRDRTFRKLIDLAAFGVPDTPPQPGEPMFKGRAPGIAASDRIVLWAGGIYDWLDPLLVIRAWERIASRFPDTHLVFLGKGHPNPATPPQRIADEAAALVAQRSVPRVHFAGWVPFDRRGSVLLEADVGVSAHPHSLETQLSFRTRLLDHLWAGLPTVATGGDELADRIAEAGAGMAVDPGDVDGFVAGLERYLTDSQASGAAGAAARALATTMTWERQLAPLLTFCAAPYTTAAAATADVTFDAAHLSRRLLEYVRQGEYRLAVNRVRAHLARLVAGNS